MGRKEEEDDRGEGPREKVGAEAPDGSGEGEEEYGWDGWEEGAEKDVLRKEARQSK